MAFLLYRDAENQSHYHEFSEEVRIGSASGNTVALPASLEVAPQHAAIVRSTINRLPVLIDLAGQDTRINGRPVVRLQVLRHGDEIHLGRAKLSMWEVRITQLRAGDQALGQMCLVCSEDFCMGDHVIICPRCRTPHHRDCWFSIDLCAYYGCMYPIHETVMDALSPWVAFDRQLEEDSPLLERKKEERIIRPGTICRAGTPRDQAPFQARQKVAYCPRCRTPYHLECWLQLNQCPVCQHKVRELIDRVFLSIADNKG